ncbi:unnamed protein product [Caenorhabditis angaria]|uniref:Uncharacterized protein n=1 Tax=Caenorhabditis angaria TaxID=860376 RepID=A0A9P1IWT5_9PELO|nr:unnamed protein product [Caenorhabditis angaria]
MLHSLMLFLVVLFVSVLSQPMDKKSDMSGFASALNNAGRLRYGKRSSWDIEQPDAAEFESYDSYYPELLKRGLNTDSLVASLKGAERLRFGRK